jgi:hypothetical protein
MLLLMFVIGCGYSVEAWWTDLAEAHCRCVAPEDWRECLDEQMLIYESAPEWAACHDEAAPVDREAVNEWTKDYSDACRTPSEPAPEPEDPNWADACEL